MEPFCSRNIPCTCCIFRIPEVKERAKKRANALDKAENKNKKAPGASLQPALNI
jgi:hypothetical protein